VWIFKSTYYPDFRRRILTILSLPKNSLFEVEYDSKWIDEQLESQLKSDPNALNGKDAYFVFLDYASNPLQFYPIRICKVHAIQPGEPYRLILKVGNLLGFKETESQSAFNNTITSWLKNRGLIEESAAKPTASKLVLSCADGSMSDAVREIEGEDDKDWQRIVKYLTEAQPIDSASQFTESLFFRFQLLDEETFEPLTIKGGKYELKPRKGYLFRLRAFQPHWKEFTPVQTAKIIFGFEEKIVNHVGASLLTMPLGQRTYNKDFRIRTTAPLGGATSKLVFEREEDEFNAASYVVPFRLPIRYGGILIRFIPFFVGLVFVGLADSIAKIITLWGLPLPGYVITLLGSLLCAVSLYQLD